MIRPRANEIIAFLLQHLRTEIKEESLYLILETLNAVMRTNLSGLNTQSIAGIGEAVFDVWLLNSTGTLNLTGSWLKHRSRRYCHRRRAVRDDRLLDYSANHRDSGQPPLSPTRHYRQHKYGSSRCGYSWRGGATCQ